MRFVEAPPCLQSVDSKIRAKIDDVLDFDECCVTSYKPC